MAEIDKHFQHFFQSIMLSAEQMVFIGIVDLAARHFETLAAACSDIFTIPPTKF